MELRVVVVAPHGYEDKTLPYRHHDRRAMYSTDELIKVLDTRGINYTRFHPANELRSVMDYNRIHARKTPLRNQIRETIKKFLQQGHYVIVFEMHSFPRGYTDYDFKKHKIAFLSIPRFAEDMRALSNYINKISDVKVIPLGSSHTNDIQWDTDKTTADIHNNNISHYLIEFYEEEKELTPRQITNIIPIIVDGAINVMNENKLNLNIMYTCKIIIILILIGLFIVILMIYTEIRPLPWIL